MKIYYKILKNITILKSYKAPLLNRDAVGTVVYAQVVYKWDLSMKFMTGVIVYHHLQPLHTFILLWLLQVDQLYPVHLNGGVMWYLCIWKCCCPLALVSYFPDI